MKIFHMAAAFLLPSAMLLMPQELRAESIKMTTYYPSPSGTYNKVSSNFVILKRQDNAPVNAQPGMLYFGANGGYPDASDQLYIYGNSAWSPVQFAPSLKEIGSKSLAGDYTLQKYTATTTYLKFLEIDNLPCDKMGLYQIAWTGNVEIRSQSNPPSPPNAPNAMDCKISIRVRLGYNDGVTPAKTIQRFDLQDDQIDDATSTITPLESSTMLALKKGAYDFYMDGYKTCGPGKMFPANNEVKTNTKITVYQLSGF